MRAYIVFLLIAACLAITIADKGLSKLERRLKRCKTNEQCSENECCVKVSSPFLGRCRKLGKRGDKCLPKDVVDKLHQARCPCQEGLECIPRRTKQTALGEIPLGLRCVRGNSTVTADEVTDEVVTDSSIVDEDVTDSSIVDEDVTDSSIVDEVVDVTSDSNESGSSETDQ